MNHRKTISILAGLTLLTLAWPSSLNHVRSEKLLQSNVRDGGDPMPNPYPKPNASFLTADGGDPMPNPYPKPNLSSQVS